MSAVNSSATMSVIAARGSWEHISLRNTTYAHMPETNSPLIRNGAKLPGSFILDLCNTMNTSISADSESKPRNAAMRPVSLVAAMAKTGKNQYASHSAEIDHATPLNPG